ncbi:MAG: IS3 family transposase [Lachnospiraceae bacterium]|nr:IS3 family transposase [Lachnospiraceae bacterium]
MFYRNKFVSSDELIVAIKEYVDYYNNIRIFQHLLPITERLARNII